VAPAATIVSGAMPRGALTARSEPRLAPVSSQPAAAATEPDQTPNQTPDHTPSHTPSQAPGQTPDHAPDHAPDQFSGQAESRTDRSQTQRAAPITARSPAPLPAVADSDSPQTWGDATETPDWEFLEAVPPHW
jgi:hypothetical protein